MTATPTADELGLTAPSTAVSHGTTTAHHAITVAHLRLPAGRPFQAACLCGWHSDVLAARPHAVLAGHSHLDHATTAAPRCPSWCVIDHEPDDEVVHSSDLIADSGDLTVFVVQARGVPRVYFWDTVPRRQRETGLAPSALKPPAQAHFTVEEAEMRAHALLEAVRVVRGQDPQWPTRASHCSCGRPAREVLASGKFGPTGYCGAPFPPLDQCFCGKGRGRAFSQRLPHLRDRNGERTMTTMRPLIEDGTTTRLIESPAPEPELTTGPVECAPWCEHGDGHPDMKYRADQCCSSTPVVIELERHPAVPDVVMDMETSQWLPETASAQVYRSRTADGVEDINVSVNNEPEIRFTDIEAGLLVEAIQLARHGWTESDTLSVPDAAELAGVSMDTLELLRGISAGPRSVAAGDGIAYHAGEVQKWREDTGRVANDFGCFARTTGFARKELSALLHSLGSDGQSAGEIWRSFPGCDDGEKIAQDLDEIRALADIPERVRRVALGVLYSLLIRMKLDGYELVEALYDRAAKFRDGRLPVEYTDGTSADRAKLALGVRAIAVALESDLLTDPSAYTAC